MPAISATSRQSSVSADDITKLSRHLVAIEAELTALWEQCGQRGPIRRDVGAVRSARDDSNRRIFEH
jgi:hypothetical protein